MKVIEVGERMIPIASKFNIFTEEMPRLLQVRAVEIIIDIIPETEAVCKPH